MVLEISFTTLNRLAALRLCEERGLTIECVRNGTKSAGFQMFERISGGALGGRYETYRIFLECMSDELALDLGVLFDRITQQSAVFPTERCMEDVLDELNTPELTHLWKEDETIGWIYQYFNPPEERKAMREVSQAPRNSRELAVRNQFFTPRYVVEFLTDNTLGRTWYEMRKGDTGLKEECRYLVRRPKEVFLAEGEKAPADKNDETDLDRDELLKRPLYIEHRPKKDPRDLRILDPACGSGHFLLYAFDLLERIYEEAWADPEGPRSDITGRTLQADYVSIDKLRWEIPKLVIENNLHGIDIDPRAVQIAALAIWLRAQKSWKRLALKAAVRPRIAKSNVVTAEPMPGEAEMRREFAAGLKPRVLGQIVEEVFEEMKLAGEAGSLLKIEEQIKDAVAAAGKQWREGPKPDEQLLFPGVADLRPKQQELRFDLKGITEDQFWEQAEERILDALKTYSERSENDCAVRRRLFADDAARGFAFIDLCRKRYDVVLMNPPFGKSPAGIERYLRDVYPDNWKDLYAAFIDRALMLIVQDGHIGCITSSQFLYTKQLQGLRSMLLEKQSLLSFIELGHEVLDGATVETALSILRPFDSTTRTRKTSYLDLTKVPIDDKGTKIKSAITEAAKFRLHELQVFSHIATIPFSFHAHEKVLSLWKTRSRLEPSLGRVATGNHTFEDHRFLRVRAEIPARLMRPRWISYEKGGEYQPFYSPTQLLVDWNEDGHALRAVNIKRHGSDAQAMQSSRYWNRCGLCYSHVSSIAFGPRVMPKGAIFSSESISIFCQGTDDHLPLLSLLCSTWVQDLIWVFGRYRKIENRAVSNLPISRRSLEKARDALTDLASKAIEQVERVESLDETSPAFCIPDAVKAMTTDCSFLRGQVIDVLQGICDRIDYVSEQCLFDNRVDVEPASKKRSELVSIFVERTGSSHSDHVHNLLSYLVGVTYGRWDVRIAVEPSLAPKLPGPFDPLPVCPPGMLLGADGLPAEANRIVSKEWLRARLDANTLPAEGTVKCQAVPDDSYPLSISWDGILVDDPGFNGNQPHRDDIVRRLREVLDLLWKDKAHEIEQEACDILGISDLRDYFRKPAGFFQDHMKRYSKSRRSAPIYWPLSTASGSYTIWFYYHRLNDQTLFAAVNKCVEPKIAETARGIASIEAELKAASGKYMAKLTDRLNDARAFLGELRGLREELLRIAALPYKPNLNDGVIINAAPLHKLFRLRSWSKDTEDCWKKLHEGDFDWSHLAYAIWPDRVRETCRKDRSIAIAHGLEDLFNDERPHPKKGRGRKAKQVLSDGEEIGS